MGRARATATVDQRARSVRRMHFRGDGSPKKALSPGEAHRARKRGLATYLCPVCGKTHAGHP